MLEEERGGVFAGEVVPYLSMGGKHIMGNMGFIRLHSTNSPIRVTGTCSTTKTSRLIFLSVATSYRRESAMISVMEQITTGMFVPFAMNNNVHAMSSFGGLLERKTSGVSMGSTTVSEPRLVDRTTSGFKDRYMIITVSTGHERSNK